MKIIIFIADTNRIDRYCPKGNHREKEKKKRKRDKERERALWNLLLHCWNFFGRKCHVFSYGNCNDMDVLIRATTFSGGKVSSFSSKQAATNIQEYSRLDIPYLSLWRAHSRRRSASLFSTFSPVLDVFSSPTLLINRNFARDPPRLTSRGGPRQTMRDSRASVCWTILHLCACNLIEPN